MEGLTPATATGRDRNVLTRRQKVAFTLLLSILFTIVMLVVGEAAVRTRAWVRYGSAQPDAMDKMGTLDAASGLRVLRPGYERHSSRVSIRINSLGFRGDD